jgi:class 3 adenylate cyclase
MQELTVNYVIESCQLKLHIGIGAGRIAALHVGGVADRREFMIAGEPLDQVGSCEKQAEPGEVYISSAARVLIASHIKEGTNGSAWGPQGMDAKPRNRSVMLKDAASKLSSPLRSLANNRRSRDVIVPILPPSDANWYVQSVFDPAPLPVEVILPDAKGTSEILSAYVPQAVLRRIGEDGVSRWLGDLRTVSVLFVALDVQNKLESSFFQLLQNAMSEMQKVLYHLEGTVRQFLVDDKGVVLIACFGVYPYAHEDDPVRAVRAGIAIHEQLESIEIGASIGITTGKVFCGAVGSEERREYAVVGDTVNLSARLMASANGGVITDEATYRASKHSSLRFRVLPEIRVKGKSNPIPVFQPVGEKSRRTQSESAIIADHNHLLVGCRKEVSYFTKLVGWLKKKKFDASYFVLLEGDAGMGKTRLLTKVQEIARMQNVKVMHGAASSIEKDTPYFAIRDAFNNFFPTGIPQQRRGFLEALFAGSDLVLASMPLLSPILNLDIAETEQSRALKGHRRAARISRLLLELLLQRDFRLLLIDNMEYVDSASWSVLAEVIQTPGFAVVLAMRPQSEQPLELRQMLDILRAPISRTRSSRSLDKLESSSEDAPFQSRFERLVLQPLSSSEAKELATYHLGIEKHLAFPPELEEELSKAEGNPLLLEEIASSLKASGQIFVSPSGSSFRYTREKAHEMQHNTLQGLVSSKIDRLSEPQQTALKIASVIGRRFSGQVLGDLYPEESSDEIAFKNHLAEELREFVNLGLLIDEGQDENRYAFRQMITQQVAYEMLLHKYRVQLHAKAAQWYEQNHSDDLTPYWTLLGYHWKNASEGAKAIEYLDKAGSAALRTHANREAVNLLSDLIELAGYAEEIRQRERGERSKRSKREKQEFDPRLIEWLRKLGQAHYNLGAFDKGELYLRAALKLLREPLPSSKARAKGRAIRLSLAERVSENAPLGRTFGKSLVSLLADSQVRKTTRWNACACCCILRKSTTTRCRRALRITVQRAR